MNFLICGVWGLVLHCLRLGKGWYALRWCFLWFVVKLFDFVVRLIDSWIYCCGVYVCCWYFGIVGVIWVRCLFLALGVFCLLVGLLCGFCGFGCLIWYFAVIAHRGFD